jgi:endoglucanase
MKSCTIRFYHILLSILTFSAIGYSQTSYSIRLNQIGFLPNAVKYAAIVGSEENNFSVKTADLSSTVYNGELSEAGYFTSGDEYVKVADFTDFSTPGEYVLVISDLGNSVPFTIDNSVFFPISRATIKGFYFNRASIELLAEHAGKWARAAGHPDTAVVVHPSAASETRPAGTIISTPYGWYDAGDYNKYVVNSGISTFTLLSAYETYPEYFDTLTWNIPESDNDIPDILDEAWWNIKWLWTMQDTADGGVYNKTTTASFEGTVMPSKAVSTRYVITKTTAAALDFAAIMAITARIYKPYMPDIAEEALEKAKLAYAWAKENPDIPFSKPEASGDYPRISTGSYGDEYFDDEFSWCAAELYVTTGDDQYYPEIDLENGSYTIPNSGSVRTLGLISLLVNRNNLTSLADTFLAKQKLLDVVEISKNNTVTTPYRIPGEFFGWGGNGIYANHGMLLMQAFKISKDAGYFNAAVATLDYLLGKNATTYCFVTGQGSKSPRYPHHRISNADGISDPVPGLLVGGPNPGNVNDDCGASAYPSLLPAKAYVDASCSYTTNEVAINWYAPIAFLIAGIQCEYLENFTEVMPLYMMTSATAINFPFKEGSTADLVLSTNRDWALSSNVNWIGFSSVSGSGNANIAVSVNEDNPTEEEREAYIYITSEDKVLDSVYVVQNGKRLCFRLEAEAYSDMFGIQTENTSDYGGGYNVAYVDADDWVDYVLDVSFSGIYQVTIRHAGYKGEFDVLVNNEVVASVSLPATSDWQDWTSGVFEIPLQEGEQTLRLLFKAEGLNINWFYFQWIENLPVMIEKSDHGEIMVYPIPADRILNIETNNTCSVNDWQLITMDGKKICGQDVAHLTSIQINTCHLKSGLYILVFNTDQGSVRKLVTIK